MTGRQHVAVVTGGGGGIGAAIAEQLGRQGCFVVTVDPLVTVDGFERLPEPKETTAGRIMSAGGSARASSVSVTDSDGIRGLFQELIEERGGLDTVVNVAGITRPTGFANGTEDDWLEVLAVHLGGYLNVLSAAMPLMARAGHGHILGVTSGSGWRAADAGAYSCAKRAVASLTWQLGRQAPAGVTVNAMSPIAATRMVTEALARAGHAPKARAGGGLSLTSMPQAQDIGPIGAYLAGDRFAWCNGKVIFAGGSEVAIIEEPRLLEAVRSDGVSSLAGVLGDVIPRAFAPAEANQKSGGGGNPRFGPIFGPDTGKRGASEDAPAVARSCAVVADHPRVAETVTAALEARSITCSRVEAARGFDNAADALKSAVGSSDPVDAVVVALSDDQAPSAAADGWERTLAEHARIVDNIHTDAGWARAVADYAAAAGRPVRLLTLTDATSAGGRSRAQASAQLARAAGSTKGKVTAFAVSLEDTEEVGGDATAELVAHLLGRDDGAALGGAELVIGGGWVGLRSHPRPAGSIVYGGPDVPDWLDTALREVFGTTGDPAHTEN